MMLALPCHADNQAMPQSPDAPDPAADIPAGFVRRVSGGPYFRALGDVYWRPLDSGGAVIALRVAESHLNIQGFTHGGMLTTLADGALGINIALARVQRGGQRGGQVTVSMSADFLASARVGDWLEAHVTVTRLGQRLAYANCDLMVGDRHILRSSAVFAFVDRPLPPAATLQPSDG
jgi:uncharacterized protein (TIGR00369 family)